MYVRYMARNRDRIWYGDSSKTWDILEGESSFSKGIYFYPSGREESVWLWMVGYERSFPDKSLVDRVWATRFVVHYCVGGRGYYNGELITKGKIFVSWPNMSHTFVTDPDDPIEFYWVMVRGRDVLDYVSDFGFNKHRLVYDSESVCDVEPLIDHIFKRDFGKVDITKYNVGMLQTVLSLNTGSIDPVTDEDKRRLPVGGYYGEYVQSSKNILHDNNYAMTVEELSGLVNIHPKHLTRVFKSELGETPKEYMTRKRIELAENLLTSGVKPTEVAKILKYENYATFYRAFVKKNQISPECYKMK